MMRKLFVLSALALAAIPACSAQPEDAVASVGELHHDCTMGATVRGVDVSEAQGTINWSTAAGGGLAFAIARVADGQHIDRQFATNYRGIQAAGLIRGSYLYWRPQVSAATQAQEIISAVGTLGPGDLPPTIDAECMCPYHSGADSHGTRGGCQTDSYSDCVDAATAAERIQDLYDRLNTAFGRPPMVYTGTWYWNGGPYLNSRLHLGSAPLWISAYPRSFSPDASYCANIDDAWTHWTFWQYSDRGHTPGIASGVDSDVFNGDLAALQAFANGTAMPPPPPPSTGAISYPTDPHPISSYVTHTHGGGLVRFDCNTITRANHKGTDMAVARGTPVHAAAAGTIIRAVDGCTEGQTTCGGSFGNHVIIQHADGRATLYGHMTQGTVRVHVNDHVECGQELGMSGNTGHSTGPHVHFEVRDGVTGIGNYYARGPTDPFGGSCSTQAHDLWGDSCHPTTPRDDARYVSSTYAHQTTVTAGQMVTQAWRLENTGTTTWTTADYALVHKGGPSLMGLPRVVVPSSVAPHAQMRFEVTFQAPTEPGDYVVTYQMAHGMMDFGDTVQLSLRVAGPAQCHSATLGTDVPSGTCVQVSYAGCGMSSCGWYACSNGAWACTDQSSCMADTHANDSCAPPPPPPGTGCAALSCGDCVATPDCAFCPANMQCMAATDASSCDSGTTTSAGACDVCHPVGFTCEDRFGCCDANSNSNIQCIQGFCEDITMCEMNGDTCDAASTSTHCCGLGLCGQDTGGQWECCLAPNNQCTTDAECCGYEHCTDGVCQAQAVGASCMNTQECAGASYCLDNHTCGF